MNGLLRDLRLGVRALGKSPGFTAVGVATLAWTWSCAVQALHEE